MTALGISFIAIGAALVCVGLALSLRVPQPGPAAPDGPDRFRTILDALEEDDRRGESRDWTDRLPRNVG
jgi:hypothetical protein